MADASKPRPADHKIPGAVRDMFSTNRMQSAWRMAQGSTQEMRKPAIDAIFRMLEAEGLTFEDVMTAVLTIKPDGPDLGKTMEDAFAGFGDIFSASPFARRGEFAAAPFAQRARPAPERAADPRPRGGMRTHRSGPDIPATIKGTVSIDDERATRNGRMLVFSITDGDVVHGPIVCFTTTGIGTLRACCDEGEMVAMSVRQPNGPGLSPSATNIRRL